MDPEITRITVDEILSDALIRFETCTLKKDTVEFFDEVVNWGEKKDVLVKRSQYRRKLDLPYPWEEFEEGQVFLSGAFEVVCVEGKPDHFRVSPGKNGFVRIDNLRKFKDKLKRVYSDLLTRR